MKQAITFSFIFITAYALAVLFGWVPAALFLFSVSPLVVLYTVYKVLKDPEEVQDTFEDKFYQDSDYERNQIKEAA
jgi:membrane protein implicated in regulation of membrane protease activity